MKDSQAMELVIIDGGQAGARSLLECGQAIEIGDSLDSDIILNDPLMDGQKIKLAIDGPAAELDVLAGEVRVQGQRFVQGQRALVSAYQTVTIGDTTFAYGEVNSINWSQMINANNDPDSIDLEGLDEENTLPVTGGAAIVGLLQRYWLYAVMALFLVLIAVGMYLSSATNAAPTLAERAAQASQMIRDEGFSELSIRANDSGVLVVTGYIATAQAYAELERLLDRQQVFALIEAQVGEQLATQVQDVYRLNGIDAVVDVEGKGVVSVNTTEVDAERLIRVRDIALKDVAGLEDVIANNLPPEIDDVIDSQGSTLNDPGKRITMVVPGDSPYIVTVDRSRYYVGAMLPSGHKVVEINQDNVLLVKNGVETALNF